MNCVFYDIDYGGKFQDWDKTALLFACICLENKAIMYTQEIYPCQLCTLSTTILSQIQKSDENALLIVETDVLFEVI